RGAAARSLRGRHRPAGPASGPAGALCRRAGALDAGPGWRRVVAGQAPAHTSAEENAFGTDSGHGTEPALTLIQPEPVISGVTCRKNIWPAVTVKVANRPPVLL